MSIIVRCKKFQELRGLLDILAAGKASFSEKHNVAEMAALSPQGKTSADSSQRLHNQKITQLWYVREARARAVVICIVAWVHI